MRAAEIAVLVLQGDGLRDVQRDGLRDVQRDDLICTALMRLSGLKMFEKGIFEMSGETI